MSATQQLKKNCQATAPSYGKSGSNQMWAGCVATVQHGTRVRQIVKAVEGLMF